MRWVWIVWVWGGRRVLQCRTGRQLAVSRARLPFRLELAILEFHCALELSRLGRKAYNLIKGRCDVRPGRDAPQYENAGGRGHARLRCDRRYA